MTLYVVTSCEVMASHCDITWHDIICREIVNLYLSAYQKLLMGKATLQPSSPFVIPNVKTSYDVLLWRHVTFHHDKTWQVICHVRDRVCRFTLLCHVTSHDDMLWHHDVTSWCHLTSLEKKTDKEGTMRQGVSTLRHYHYIKSRSTASAR